MSQKLNFRYVSCGESHFAELDDVAQLIARLRYTDLVDFCASINTGGVIPAQVVAWAETTVGPKPPPKPAAR